MVSYKEREKGGGGAGQTEVSEIQTCGMGCVIAMKVSEWKKMTRD